MKLLSWSQNTLPYSLKTMFGMGEALTYEPRADEVLNSFVSDAAGLENTGSFEEWCDEYGADDDSRKAEALYRRVEKGRDELRVFLGDLYDAYLWETESL